jgi:hypothetical protein
MLRTLAEGGKLRPRALVLGWPTSEVSTFFFLYYFRFDFFFEFEQFRIWTKFIFEKKIKSEQNKSEKIQILAISENCSTWKKNVQS